MPKIIDRHLTAEEIDTMTQPYRVGMEAIFRDAEMKTLALIEEKAAAGATEGELVKSIEDLLGEGSNTSGVYIK